MARIALMARGTKLTLCIALLMAHAPLSAQKDTTRDGRTMVPKDTAHVHKTLFTYRDAILAGGFAVLTVAMFPLDKHVAEKLQNPDVRANQFFNNAATGVEWITTPGSFIIGGGLYAVGRVAKKEDVADLGWHGTEAILLASGITSFLKGTLGRARPYVSNDTNPHDFKLFRGFGRDVQGFNNQNGAALGKGDFQSFPSGHTTTAFAAASAVTSEARRIWPKSVPFVAPVMYGGATLVGLSRMYHNNHWASDVALGAAIGTFSGIKVVRYSHSHPNNRIDRVILGATIIPLPDGGAAVSVSLPAP